MNNIAINTNDKGEVVVNGRDLHAGLEVKSKYTVWIERMIDYGFVENTDYILVSQKRETNNPKNPYTEITDHILKLDMAKEIAMIQRSEVGKRVRQYFIQVEKDFNSPEKVMARALKLADEKLNTLKIEMNAERELNKLNAPKVLFADSVSASSQTILVGDLAKLIRQNGVDIGQNRLFRWMRENGYLIRRKGESYNMPTQKSMDAKLFEIKESSHINSDGSVRITKTPKVTGKGQQYFVNKFLNN